MQENIEQVVSEVPPAIADNGEEATSIGKFSDSEALLKAYNSLEAEFTKKCQQLKAIEGKAEEAPAAQQKAEIQGEPTPLYENDNWKETVENFEKANPIAKAYSKEISRLLSEDAALAKDKRCLEIALSKVLSDRISTPDNIVKDEDFLKNYIYSNQDIKDKIVAEFLENLSFNAGVPRTISHGGTPTITPPSKASSLEEAGVMAEKMLRTRRI